MTYKFFAYEGFDGCNLYRFGNYSDAEAFSVDENGNPIPVELCCYLASDLYGSCEKESSLQITSRPSLTIVKEFIRAYKQKVTVLQTYD